MNRISKAITVLTAVAALDSLGVASAASRCEADLARVDKGFCLQDKHVTADGKPAAQSLSYSWRLNDASFDLSSKVCITGGGRVGAYKDMIFALDRSQSIWGIDSSLKKIGADSLSTVTYLIEKLRKEAQAHPDQAPKVSIMMFSTSPSCSEWTTPSITVDKEFPCLYVTAKSIADDAQYQKLMAFLKAAKGKFSQGGLADAGELGIVSDLLATDKVGLNASKNGLMLFSDGRTFAGKAGDTYAYLRGGSYASGQAAALKKFGAAAMKRFQLVFALSPIASPVFDESDTYDTMCQAPGAVTADCDTTKGININDPKTWPANKIDVKAYASKLVTALGGNAANGVIVLDDKQKADPGLESLRQGNLDAIAIDSVSYSVDGQAAKAGRAENGRIILEGLAAEGSLDVAVTITSRGKSYVVPVHATTEQVEYDGEDFTDQEMFCKAGDPLPAKLSLANLQGGSASCGVTAASSAASSSLLLWLMLLPVLAGAAFSRLIPRSFAALLAAGLALAVIFPEGAFAAEEDDETKGGLNALQYRPVVDGVGSSERATTMGAGGINAGLYMDYANDAIELGGEGNERASSVMDDLVTAHMAASVGVHQRASVGIHVPYVHKSDVDRDLDGDQIEGGQLGQPADMAVMVKINIMNRPSYSLGVQPMATVPTGDPDLLLGDGSSNYGFLMLLSGVRSQWTWATNAGYMHREKALELEDDRANKIEVQGQGLVSGGVEYRMLPFLSLGGSVQAKFSTGDDVDFTRSNPAEWLATAKYRPLLGLETFAGFGTGIGKGYGSPDYRAVLGVAWVPDAHTRRTVAGR
jgi:hypothetical protein